MKMRWILLVFVTVFGFYGVSNAALSTIGTATYNALTYNLIYEDDQHLVWLDFSRPKFTWSEQNTWAAGLGGNLTVTLNPGYSTTIDWTTGWRLPTTVDGPWVMGYNGQTTGGYNITSSEMGHLFYESLGNKGYRDTSGAYPAVYGLTETGPFNNLLGLVNDFYWSSTVHAGTSSAWRFYFYYGSQDFNPTSNNQRALAVHSGTVSTVPLPAAFWLFGAGLFGLAGIRRRIRD